MQAVRLISIGVLCLAMPLAAANSAGVIIGDSIGVGVAEVSGLHNYARNGIHIRGPRALQQMREAPANSTAYVVLGTNDAEGSIKRLDKYIDDLLDLAKKKNISIVWLGPPCVRKAWDSRGRELDEMLRNRFAATSVKYVSMRDSVLCSGKFQEPDGVHLKRPGYVYMWQKVLAATEGNGYALASAKELAAERTPPVKTAAADTHKAATTGSVTADIAVPAIERRSADDADRHTRTVFIFPRASAQ